MNNLPNIAARIFNTPLLISHSKLETILSVIKPRLQGGKIQLAQKQARRSFEVTPYGVAIIPVLGTLVRRTAGMDALSGLMSYGQIESQLAEAVSDPMIKAILLDIDSPGGEAGGVFDLADQIFEARKSKPIWAVANEEAFSSAYAIACAAEKIYLPRTGGVGSVGVIAVHLDQSKFDEKEGFSYTAVFAGARKNDLSPHEPLSDSAKSALQAEVDRIYGLFTSSVAKMRGISLDTIKATEAGLFFGEKAIASGFADRMGTLGNALFDLSQHIAQSTRAATPIAKEMSMDTNTTPAKDEPEKAVATGENSPADPAPEKPQEEDQDAVKAEQGRCLGIMAAARKLRAPESLAQSFIEKGMSLAKANAALIDWKASQEEKDEIFSHSGGIKQNNQVLTGDEKWESEYKASADLQGEFRSLAAYKAYQKAQSQGLVKSNRKGA